METDRVSPSSLAVAICTHNPRRDYLERTLASLRSQTKPAEEWELLIVDNKSGDLGYSLSDIVGVSGVAFPNVRVVREEKVGLTPARLRAIHETSSDLLLFIDDDNVLAPDYLERLLEIAGRFPQLGCLGAGRLEPEFEQEPAPEFRPHLAMLALRIVDRPAWAMKPEDEMLLPWGAGLCVRRKVAVKYAETVTRCPVRMHLDRAGGQLNSGGDNEFSHVAAEAGLGQGIFPELRITHLIGRERVQPDYLYRLAEGHAYSHAFLQKLHGGEPWRLHHPTPGGALGKLARGKLWDGLREMKGWMNRGQVPETERKITAAKVRGIQKAVETMARSERG